MMNIIFFINVSDNEMHYLTKKNSLCYSWIPYNKYEIRKRLCNINCSYIRYIPFPLNKPFLCKYNKSENQKISSKHNNISLYYFNTSTYGKYISKYRFIYKNVREYSILSNRILM